MPRRPAAALALVCALGLLGFVSLLALSGCQSLAPTAAAPWLERRGALQALERYDFSGQLAAATATEGFSAGLHWQQQGVASALQLRGPLGAGGAHLDFDGADLRVTASNGTVLEGEAAHAELVRLLGFEPPLSSLRYWLLGVPDPAAPASEVLDATQRLAQLRQFDWQVDYSEYSRVPLAGSSGAADSAGSAVWLPGRLSLQRGALRLKLHVAHWVLP